MKKIYAILLVATFAFLLSSCIDMMEDVKDVKKIEPISVSFKVCAATGFIPKGGTITPDPNFSTAGVDVIFTNVKTGQVFRGVTGSNSIATVEIEPGVYSISVTGRATHDGYQYFINGNVPSITVYEDVTPEQANTDEQYRLVVRPAKVGSFCISEIYYCGVASYYFRDQTYQFTNNSDAVFYLDGVCFAQLHPNLATANLPTWPDEDGEGNYVYSMMVWQFPGTGTDYPVMPGESVVVAQEPRDHTVNNPNSYDNSMADFQTWTGNASRYNPDVPNLTCIFYTNWNSMQWLTSVFGAAFCVFKAPAGTTVDEAYYKDPAHYQTEVEKTSKYAKIPADWVLDGVELLTNMSAMHMKRIPGFVDAGGTSVEATYCGKSVSRKVVEKRSDGTPKYQDTNNSTDDFQVNDHPVIRRNGEKVPSWTWYK